MPYTDKKSYDFGSRLVHVLRVEVEDKPADPTNISIYFVDPNGTQSGPFTPVKMAQGLYTYEKTYNGATGDWYSRWVGTGHAEGAKERAFHINRTRFT